MERGIKRKKQNLSEAMQRNELLKSSFKKLLFVCYVQVVNLHGLSLALSVHVTCATKERERYYGQEREQKSTKVRLRIRMQKKRRVFLSACK